jgi:predicted nucleotide-binding protein (sugar kinase/HSP70/actin superfamily)
MRQEEAMKREDQIELLRTVRERREAVTSAWLKDERVREAISGDQKVIKSLKKEAAKQKA